MMSFTDCPIQMLNSLNVVKHQTGFDLALASFLLVFTVAVVDEAQLQVPVVVKSVNKQ